MIFYTTSFVEVILLYFQHFYLFLCQANMKGHQDSQYFLQNLNIQPLSKVISFWSSEIWFSYKIWGLIQIFTYFTFFELLLHFKSNFAEIWNRASNRQKFWSIRNLMRNFFCVTVICDAINGIALIWDLHDFVTDW